MNITEILKQTYKGIHDKIYDYNTIKLKPSQWTEKNVYLTSDVSRFQGYFKYDLSPYAREIIDNLDSANPVKIVAVMKCAQAGITQGVIIPGICNIIDQTPAPILFIAGNEELAKNSVRTRLDPIIKSSGIQHKIRPNVTRKRNQRTGDTDKNKEFAGGQLIVGGCQNVDKLRQFSVKYIFADDWDTAPIADKDEGTIRNILEGRATSFGNMAKIFYISTPKTLQISNINPLYLLGDQRKWHWSCPHCNTYIPVEWRVNRDDKSYGGIKYTLEDGKLIPESVHYECQHCRGKINETDKYNLNLKGKWIPTTKPSRPEYRSYYMNALIIPPGFLSWKELVYQWLEANPPNGVIDVEKLKTFVTIRLGQPWEDQGEIPKVHKLMKNTRDYIPGVVPDLTCEKDGNGKILLISLAADLNGIMKQDKEDVRLDWEILGHSTTGVTYSIDQGSIGTFKRIRDKTSADIENEKKRVKWTYTHGVPNSVWPELAQIIQAPLATESGQTKQIMISLIDTGYFTLNANTFINKHAANFVFGVKGQAERNHRAINRDTPLLKPSRELNSLYILEVNAIKDMLAANMKLQKGSDGYQPPGFMNYPQPRDGKYSYENYFKHYEGEQRVEVKEGEQTIGFKWEKRTNAAQNHFWDVRIYNLAAVYLFIDLLRKSSPKRYKYLKTWSDFVSVFDF